MTDFNDLECYTIDPRGRLTMPLAYTRQAPEWVGILTRDCLIMVPTYSMPDAQARRMAFRCRPTPGAGRFTVPAVVRQALGIRPGDEMVCTGMGRWVEYWRPDLFRASARRPTVRAARRLAAEMIAA
jgi:DNA-binding transcriptional regulator/RsmH inhibitor MraZ